MTIQKTVLRMRQAGIKRILMLAPLLLLACQGCFLFPSPPSGNIASPASCRTGDPLADIRKIGQSIKSLDAFARIQVTVRGRKQPSVRCAVKWSHNANGERMRVTGSGPFGITVFDALLRDNLFLLYIPSHDAVYFADISQGMHTDKTGREMSSLAIHARMVLNPWSALDVPDTSRAQCAGFPGIDSAGDTLCFISQGDGMIRSAFSRLTMTPYVIETDGCRVKYTGVLEQPEPALPCVLYPSSITVQIKDYDLRLDIRVKEVTFNTASPEQPAFDTLPFMSMRLLPLEMLLHSVR